MSDLRCDIPTEPKTGDWSWTLAEPPVFKLSVVCCEKMSGGVATERWHSAHKSPPELMGFDES